MIFDSHTHTKFSADSEMRAADAIARAQSLGRGIIFTEHFDYKLPGETDFTFDAAAYFSEYEKFRSDSVRLGVEVGLRKIARAANKNFLNRADFDFVIGSIHVVDEFDIYNPEFFAGKDKVAAFKKYFAVMAEEISLADFDALGHIDYICRVAPYENPEIDYATFKAEIDAVLKIVVERGKILELNTRRLDKIRGLKELAPVYRQYKNFGGRYVTLGSDAHRAENIGANFERALEFTEELGLTPVSFLRRELDL